jgi:hypothetical protein
VSSALVRAVDVKPGMYLIVRAWLDEKQVDPQKPMGDLTVEEFRMVHTPPKPIGEPFRVLAVALPFITLEACQNRVRGVFDTRRAELMAVDLEYAQTLYPQYIALPVSAPPPSWPGQSQQNQINALSAGTFQPPGNGTGKP